MKPVSSIEWVQTERLVCERLRMEHVPEVARLLRDPRVASWLWLRGAPSEREVADNTAEKERHWARYGFGLWLLRDRDTGEAVGWGGLQWTYVVGFNQVEAAWAIHPDRWGQGLATEMARAAVDVAFGALELHELIAFTLPHNLASRRVMEKAGFVFDRDIVYAGRTHVLYRRHAEA